MTSHIPFRDGIAGLLRKEAVPQRQRFSSLLHLSSDAYNSEVDCCTDADDILQPSPGQVHYLNQNPITAESIDDARSIVDLQRFVDEAGARSHPHSKAHTMQVARAKFANLGVIATTQTQEGSGDQPHGRGFIGEKRAIPKVIVFRERAVNPERMSEDSPFRSMHCSDKPMHFSFHYSVILKAGATHTRTIRSSITQSDSEFEQQAGFYWGEIERLGGSQEHLNEAEDVKHARLWSSELANGNLSIELAQAILEKYAPEALTGSSIGPFLAAAFILFFQGMDKAHSLLKTKVACRGECEGTAKPLCTIALYFGAVGIVDVTRRGRARVVSKRRVISEGRPYVDRVTELWMETCVDCFVEGIVQCECPELY